MVKPWPKLKSQPLEDYRIFRIRSDLKTSPRTGQEHDFFVIECVNWVNVIAVTPDGKMVMVEQFRHGSETVELEIPGGIMDAHETDPLITAVRELREETGYEGTAVQRIGQIFPNPAIMNNTCYTVLITGCRLTHPQALDAGEDLETRLVEEAEIPRLVASGKIQHSLVVVALYHYQLWKKGERTS